MIKITAVTASKNYSMVLEFSDGTKGSMCFKPYLKRNGFKPLLDKELFIKPYLVHGVVTWTDEIDIAPEALYATTHDLPEAISYEQVLLNEEKIK